MLPKRKRFIAPMNQEKLLKAFQNYSEDDTFLKKNFFGDNDNEVSDCELMASDGGSNDDNTEEIGDLIIVMSVKYMHLKYLENKSL